MVHGSAPASWTSDRKPWASKDDRAYGGCAVWLKGGVSHLALGLIGKETRLLLWSSALSPGSSPHQPSALTATSPGVGRQAPRALLVSAHQRVGRGQPCGVPHQPGPCIPQPSPSGLALPDASAQQQWLALDLGRECRPPQVVPAGGGISPTISVPGGELASREKSRQGA